METPVLLVDAGVDLSACQQRLSLTFDHCRFHLLSNSAALLAELERYFSAYISLPAADKPVWEQTLYLYQSSALNLPLAWKDWPREAGKTGKKDSYVDVQNGRWLRKVKTGMVFFQSQNEVLAVGPCEDNPNQVVNFINNQHMNWLQQQGGLICHAAALEIAGCGVAVAAFSGGGKSTTMLQLLALPDSRFITNDRLFIYPDTTPGIGRGIAKLPRINPGTIVHNSTLHPLISQEERRRLLALSPDELWHLEQKYDVHLDELFGTGRIALETPLQDLLILNWQRDSEQDTCLTDIDINTRPELIAAVAKNPGPFYQDASGAFLTDAAIPDPSRYLAALSRLRVYEVSGRVDFTRLVALYQALRVNQQQAEP